MTFLFFYSLFFKRRISSAYVEITVHGQYGLHRGNLLRKRVYHTEIWSDETPEMYLYNIQSNQAS